MNFFKRGKKIKKITLGICAMAKKAESKPMKEMLSRLPEELFEIKIFGNSSSSKLGFFLHQYTIIMNISYHNTFSTFPNYKEMKIIFFR